MAVPAGIPTLHAGIRFRSRLEARWAAFFDEIGWRWEYEPFDLEGYIPDFLIQGERPLLVEIGPCVMQADYEGKATKINRTAEEWSHDVLVLGSGPLPNLSISYDDRSMAAGWLGEQDETGYAWGPAIWAYGLHVDRLAIFHDFMDWSHRPNPGREAAVMDRAEVESAWANAVNSTQWRP